MIDNSNSSAVSQGCCVVLLRKAYQSLCMLWALPPSLNQLGKILSTFLNHVAATRLPMRLSRPGQTTASQHLAVSWNRPGHLKYWPAQHDDAYNTLAHMHACMQFATTKMGFSPETSRYDQTRQCPHSADGIYVYAIYLKATASIATILGHPKTCCLPCAC